MWSVALEQVSAARGPSHPKSKVGRFGELVDEARRQVWGFSAVAILLGTLYLIIYVAVRFLEENSL